MSAFFVYIYKSIQLLKLKIKLISFIGNWAEVKFIREISGPIALEFGSQTYVTAMDNGLFTLGPPHNEGLYFF